MSGMVLKHATSVKKPHPISIVKSIIFPHIVSSFHLVLRLSDISKGSFFRP